MPASAHDIHEHNQTICETAQSVTGGVFLERH